MIAGCGRVARGAGRPWAPCDRKRRVAGDAW